MNNCRLGPCSNCRHQVFFVFRSSQARQRSGDAQEPPSRGGASTGRPSWIAAIQIAQVLPEDFRGWSRKHKWPFQEKGMKKSESGKLKAAEALPFFGFHFSNRQISRAPLSACAGSERRFYPSFFLQSHFSQNVKSSAPSNNPTPKHVAIIMDGNGRWAKERGLPRIEGHRRGAESVKRALKAAQSLGVKYLTLYAFSVENWNRPQDEIDGLMNLLDRFLADQLKDLLKRKIRLRVVGRYKELPQHIQKRLRDAESRTAEFTGHTLALALNYGARTELIDAVRAAAADAKAGELDLAGLDYDRFRQYLYTRDIPDPDLLIRTSGECRLSNFLLLQAAYSEIHITDVLWPDFNEKHFAAALDDYYSRERRYGKTGDQIQTTQTS